MKVYGLWYGGSSYALGSIEEDLEEFDSLSKAMVALNERNNEGGFYKCRFNFVNKEPGSFYTPVTEGSEMLIYFADPTDSADPYPDRIIKFGPRGGVVVEYA